MLFLNFIFGDSGMSSAQDAADCYQRAANLYKMDKNWNSAAQAFLSAAKLHQQGYCRHEAALNYVEAAKCFRKYDVDLAVDTLVKAIDYYTEMGRFTLAARYHQTVAEIFETKGVLFINKAIQHYKKAADYYRYEEANSAANNCLLKVAHYASHSENYLEAIKIYKEAAEGALQSSLLKFSAKEYLFRATLCHLVVDMLDAKRALASYIEMCPEFEDSREYKFLQTLIGQTEEQNVEAFTQAVIDYDRISNLDPWYVMILLRIKRQISGNPDIR